MLACSGAAPALANYSFMPRKLDKLSLFLKDKRAVKLCSLDAREDSEIS